MSFVTTQPELLGGRPATLQGIGSAMTAGNAAAAAPDHRGSPRRCR